MCTLGMGLVAVEMAVMSQADDDLSGGEMSRRRGCTREQNALSPNVM